MNERMVGISYIMTGSEPNQYMNTGMSPNIEKITELRPKQYTNTGMSPIQ